MALAAELISLVARLMVPFTLECTGGLSICVRQRMVLKQLMPSMKFIRS
jgi:hypothetical protein